MKVHTATINLLGGAAVAAILLTMAVAVYVATAFRATERRIRIMRTSRAIRREITRIRVVSLAQRP